MLAVDVEIIKNNLHAMQVQLSSLYAFANESDAKTLLSISDKLTAIRQELVK